jgi:hypothetical protein
MSWGPWQYEGIPEVGVLVQVECQHEHTSQTKMEQGVIEGCLNGCCWFVGELPKMTSNWVALRWRYALDQSRSTKQTKLEEMA